MRTEGLSKKMIGFCRNHYNITLQIDVSIVQGHRILPLTIDKLYSPLRWLRTVVETCRIVFKFRN
jgi:hypothetical protein